MRERLCQQNSNLYLFPLFVRHTQTLLNPFFEAAERFAGFDANEKRNAKHTVDVLEEVRHWHEHLVAAEIELIAGNLLETVHRLLGHCRIAVLQNCKFILLVFFSAKGKR